jgi:hypothetical protein
MHRLERLIAEVTEQLQILNHSKVSFANNNGRGGE